MLLEGSSCVSERGYCCFFLQSNLIKEKGGKKKGGEGGGRSTNWHLFVPVPVPDLLTQLTLSTPSEEGNRVPARLGSFLFSLVLSLL